MTNKMKSTQSTSEISNVEEVLSILNPTNNVLELRILNTDKGTVSGYFNDMKKLANVAKSYYGKYNVFFTLNPCDTDLLKLCNNKTKSYAQSTTGDRDIKKRIWLPIDFDPIRKSGISSTDEEHSTALERATDVKKFLSDNGFSDGILADSGNGAHLLYKIDMENNNENRDLIKNFLLALDFLFSDDKVDIDTSVFNASRIWKLYGTMAVKGENSNERPHRLSKILYSPKELENINIEKIKKICSFLPSPTPPTSNSSKHKFNVDEFIEKHGIEVYKKKPYEGGSLWNIKCPMNEEHTNKSAYIIQFSNGAIGAGCHHNSCNWDWKKLRKNFEANYSSNETITLPTPPPHLAQYNEKLFPYYGIDENGMVYKPSSKDGESQVLISNFIAIPLEHISIDDGYQETKKLKLKGYVEGKELPTVTIDLAEFQNMNWISTFWGLKPNIFANYGGKDKMRDIIQRLADFSIDSNEFNHLGWRKINNNWCYLHSNGAIGAENIKVNVKNEGLQNYELQSSGKLTETEIRCSMKQSIDLLDLHQDAFILWSVCYLAPLCEALRQANYEPGFSVWVEGRSGSQKSTLSALFLNHFGKGFSVTNLPASFKDTTNATERKASICKDSLLVIDDFKPSTSKRERDSMIQKAREILWNYANRSGRQRMKADTTLRQAYVSGGMAIFTAEDNVSVGGESTVVRYIGLNLKRGELNLDKLSEIQSNAILLNQAMSAYIQWLSLKMDSISPELKLQFETFRTEFISSIKVSHDRFYQIIAWIKLGLTYGLQFATEINAITEDKKNEIINTSMTRLVEIVKEQSKQSEDEKISDKFITTLSELIDSCKVKILPLNSDELEDDDNVNSNTNIIGWCDDEFYYLLPEVTYSEINSFYLRQGSDFGVSKNTLYKELRLDEIIISNQNDNRAAISKKIRNETKRVLQIPKYIFAKETTDDMS